MNGFARLIASGSVITIYLFVASACSNSDHGSSKNQGASGGSSGARNGSGDLSCVSGVPATTTAAPNGLVCVDGLTEFSFASYAVAYSWNDCASCAAETTVTLSHPEAGKLCLSGHVADGGIAGFNLELARRNPDATEILETFDADARGITQAAFTVDSPPRAGVSLLLHILRQTACPDGAMKCDYPPNFVYGTSTDAGPIVAPLVSFISDDSSVALNTHELVDFLFQVGPGDYDFCIHDFRLLDSKNKEVTP